MNIAKDLPLYIRVHEKDNVAIVVNNTGLTAGTEFPCGLVLREHIPQGHKVALSHIEKGGEIIRYGQVIGYSYRNNQKSIVCFIYH